MIREKFNISRALLKKECNYDVVVVGGGLAGTTAAIAAAREGVKVALVQDRPILGGNSSSEVRLWILGATSHMGNNNRWAREGGITDEILIENLYRNKEGNPVIFDTILIEMVRKEENIDLFLNTAVFDILSEGYSRIEQITAFNSQNSTLYEFSAEIFIDSSGDGILAYQAGVPFRMGAEKPEEFGEAIAPDVEEYGELLGHTLYFYSKKTEKPVEYVAPGYALKDISEIPRIGNVKVGEDGCNLWWFEYGGRRDTVHETEEIKMELWKVAYGVWDHIKNSGEYEGAENYTLEWVGLIPGKRESRRFEGQYMLSQTDLIEQKEHVDAISYGGWAIDIHPADGVYSSKPGCSQWHSKGVYQIPLGCYIPKGIDNLFLAGRNISASHVAFGSTRVMATCSHGGQAVGVSAAYAVKNDLCNRDTLKKPSLDWIRQILLSKGHYVPGYALSGDKNLLSQATKIEASSELSLKELKSSGAWEHLNFSMAQMLPVVDVLPEFKVQIRASEKAQLKAAILLSSKKGNHTPDVLVKEFEFDLLKGEQVVSLRADHILEEEQYVFYTLYANEAVEVALSDTRISGILSVYNKMNPAVSNYGKQEPLEGIGVEAFEFWTPKRRPEGLNMAFQLSRAISCFKIENIVNGVMRPVNTVNAWVADLNEKTSEITVEWGKKVKVLSLRLFFDPDYDHPLESVQFGHPERVVPFMQRDYKIFGDKDELLFEKDFNYQAVNTICFEKAKTLSKLKITINQDIESVPSAVFGIEIRG